ncbi:iron ABC transporter permease [Micromonospora craniellae]|uniref:Iron ABC transporter permease n=1 Tax=Micromonospora craniellae TaxID=2294034 RepID=A0A372FYM5_9ACTN|nr:iron ABC transporter permease [Micromonospora craniellae]RFS45911.1 iron ABC transporter permease [Micromonospora craniellae]
MPLVVLLAVVCLSGVLVGSVFLSTSEAFDGLLGRGDEATQIIIRDMRLPRTVAAVVVGLCLGLAGALMQALVRNPIADPGLLGVNAGASLAVVLAVGMFGLTHIQQYMWFALAGALLVSTAVYLLGFSRVGTSPAALVLAGVAISAVLLGIVTALSLTDPESFNVMRGWLAGSVVGRDLSSIGMISPVVLVAALTTVATARPLGQLALGEDLARSLGVPVTATRIAVAGAVALLAGAATAVAGPILFIGLMVPQIARWIAGTRLGWVLAYSAVLGALLMLVADVAGRLVIWPDEAPAGLMTALLGAPVLIMLARGDRIRPS